MRNPVPRYDDGASMFQVGCNLELFEHPGRCFSSQGYRNLTTQEWKATFLYILTNIPEMDDFFKYVFSLNH